MRYIVNVEVLLYRDGRWLLIERGGQESHAAGTLGGVGGKADNKTPTDDILEETARREVAEEIGVHLGAAPLRYVWSSQFQTGSGDPVINVVLTAELPEGARPVAASPSEVAGLCWVTEQEARADPRCPQWTLTSLRRAAAVVADPVV